MVPSEVTALCSKPALLPSEEGLPAGRVSTPSLSLVVPPRGDVLLKSWT